jgi:hypothetical protein
MDVVGDKLVKRGGAWKWGGAVLVLLMAMIAIRELIPERVPAIPLGIEAAALVRYAGPRLEPAPYRDGAPLTVRIAGVGREKHDRVYDVRYIINATGTHDLRKYLQAVDGSSLVALPVLKVRGESTLGDAFDGQLPPADPVRIDIWAGYYRAMAAAAVLWIGWLLMLIFYKRERAVAPVESRPVEPTLAELLLPLIRLAEDGRLELADKAKLDLLLLKYWRQELRLNTLALADGIERIRRDPETGVILETVERWLHSAAHVDAATVVDLLKPYCPVSDRQCEATGTSR